MSNNINNNVRVGLGILNKEKSALEKLAEVTGKNRTKELSKIELMIVRSDKKIQLKRAILNLLVDAMMHDGLDSNAAQEILWDINREFEDKFGSINVLF